MFRRFLFVLVACFPLFSFAKSPSETLQASQGKLDAALSSAPEKGSAEAKKRRSTLESEAKKLFDFETLAQKALGKNWETGTPEQQAEFVSLFSGLVQDKYLDQIEGNSAKGFVLSWGNEDLSGDTAVVKATVEGKTAEGKDVHIKLSYKMIQKTSGWMVYDVVTDDSSLVETYKDSFGKMFKKEGSFEAVLVKLRGKAGKKAPVVETPAPKLEPAPKESGFVAPKATPTPKTTPKPVTKVRSSEEDVALINAGLRSMFAPLSDLFSDLGSSIGSFFSRLFQLRLFFV